jgi:hypothetical protein
MAAAKVKAIAGVVTTRSALANLSPFNLAGQALAIAGSGCTLRAINKNTQLAFSCPNIQVCGWVCAHAHMPVYRHVFEIVHNCV